MEEEGWLKAGVAAVLAKRYAEHEREFLDLLARLLEEALPAQVEVTRKGGLFAREKVVTGLRIDLGDERYHLSAGKPGAPLQGERALVKRGIVLRTQELPVPEWIEELSRALEEHAQQHQATSGALRRFLE